MKPNSLFDLQHYRRAFLSLTQEFWPQHNLKQQEKILKNVRKTNPTASIEDAKDTYLAFCIYNKSDIIPSVESAANETTSVKAKPGGKRYEIKKNAYMFLPSSK